MDDSDKNITKLLLAWRGGDTDALTELMPQVYLRLREIASHLLRREKKGHTLETSALVHEAYLQLIDLDHIGWKDRAHFFAMGARIMRRVLVDHARYLQRDKRGGNARRIETSELRSTPHQKAPDIMALDEALRELARHDAEKAYLVELRFFGGLDRREIAEVLDISTATVTRRWLAARAWLAQYLSGQIQ